MTRIEAIKQLEILLAYCKIMLNISGEIWKTDCEVLNIAIAALRGPTREQVERLRGAWEAPADGYADWELVWGEWTCSKCVSCINSDDSDNLPKFCPSCGAPMTDEAVEIMFNRLEALYGEP